jgi:PAS domain S-box-containing protein
MKDKLHFIYLPAYSEFLLTYKKKEFASEQLRILRELNIPLLKYYKDYSDEQLIEQGIERAEFFLSHLKNNKASSYIDDSIKKWLANQIPLITKEKLVPEDITLLSFARRKVFRDLLSSYTQDNLLSLKIMEEIDAFTVELDTFCFKHLLDLQRRLYEQAEALAHIGNWIWDLNTKFLVWSEEMFRIYELEPVQDANIYNIRSFTHPDDRALVDQEMENSTKKLEPHDFYYRIILKNGKEKYVHAKGQPEVNPDNIVVRMFGTLQDVSGQKRIEDELKRNEELYQEKNKKLEQANKDLESFSYIASHDLQEPLRKIQAFTSRILQKENENLSAWGKDVFAKVQTSANRMQRLIEALLSFSKLDKTHELYEPTDINLLFEEIRNNFHEIIVAKKAVIKSDQLPVMNVIPIQFQQLLTNLLNNALKYSKADVSPLIKITYGLKEGKLIPGNSKFDHNKYHHISITDNGIGFDPEYAEKIFELFQRLHGKSEYEGTGIGLAICKKIVDNHHGFITAIGHPGKGAEFNIYIPSERKAEVIEKSFTTLTP